MLHNNKNWRGNLLSTIWQSYNYILIFYIFTHMLLR